MQVRFRRCAAGLSAGALLIGAFTAGAASASTADATADRSLDQAAGPLALGTSSMMVEAAQQQHEAKQQKKQKTAEAAEQDKQAAEKERRVQQILEKASAEVGTVETGSNCQPYSPQCVSWCALFAMWAWEEAGVDVDNENYAFTGNVYTTGQEKGTAYDAASLDQAEPGDVLLFGTGPASASTSRHIGIVEKVEGDTVTTIEGNSGDNADRVQRNQHPLSVDVFYGGVHPW